MLALTLLEWLGIGTLFFTGATALSGFLIYQLARTLAGHGQSIRIRRGFRDSPYIEQGPPLIAEDRIGTRMAVVHMFNRSEVRQEIEFDLKKTRIVWPRMERQPVARFSLLNWAGGNGGTVGIALWDPEKDLWPDDARDPDTGCYRRRYWLRVTARTQNGKRLRWFGPVRVRPPAHYISPATSAG